MKENLMSFSDDFLTEFADILEIDETELKKSYTLSEDDWTSLALIGMIALIDEHYDVTIRIDALVACRNLDDLHKLITSKKNST